MSAPTHFTSASLYAIGPFDPSLIDCLEYGPDLLTSLRPGTSICTLVCHAFEEQVIELAQILSIDPWALEQHHLDPARIDASALDRADFAPTSTVERLRAAGFSFHFVLAL